MRAWRRNVVLLAAPGPDNDGAGEAEKMGAERAAVRARSLCDARPAARQYQGVATARLEGENRYGEEPPSGRPVVGAHLSNRYTWRNDPTAASEAPLPTSASAPARALQAVPFPSGARGGDARAEEPRRKKALENGTTLELPDHAAGSARRVSA